MTDKANALAEKITQKAVDTLEGLDREMTLMKWPADFRVIMWGAVADLAANRRAEAKSRS